MLPYEGSCELATGANTISCSSRQCMAVRDCLFPITSAYAGNMVLMALIILLLVFLDQSKLVVFVQKRVMSITCIKLWLFKGT